MDKQEKVTPEVNEKMRYAMRGDEVEITRQIRSGTAQAFNIEGCYLVTRIEGKRWGDELVVMVAAGENLLPAAQAIISQCQKQGIASIRFHTQRPALQRLLKKLMNFEEVERIYRVKL